MKTWNGYGSEHSMNLVMIGKFKDAHSAAAANQLLEQLKQFVSDEFEAGRIRIGETEDRFSDEMREKLGQLKCHGIGPAEMEQFVYDVRISLSDKTIELRTDEGDVSAFLKILLDKGGRVEVFSAHDYPDSDDRSHS